MYKLFFIALIPLAGFIYLQKPIHPAPLHLIANTGFYDPITKSSINIYHSDYFIHDSIGFFHCYFYDKITYIDNNNNVQSNPPQLFMSFAAPLGRIKINIHFVQMNLCGGDTATFLTEINRGNSFKCDTIYSKVTEKSKEIVIETCKPSLVGNYLIKTFGVFKNSNCNFSVNRVTINYL